jgi:hypothetical protein
MTNALTLVIPLAQDADLLRLGEVLAKSQPDIDAALTTVGTVHYARFVVFDASSPNLQPHPDSKGPFSLAVITEYDKDFNTYIQAFVTHLGPVFDTLLSFSATGQDLIPVKDNLQAFTTYVADNDSSQQPPNAPSDFYQAYPFSVQDIHANVPPSS